MEIRAIRTVDAGVMRAVLQLPPLGSLCQVKFRIMGYVRGVLLSSMCCGLLRW